MSAENNSKPIFRAEKVGSDKWMGIGIHGNSEIWSDGCFVDSEWLAERIALNMRAAFEYGVKWAKRQMEAKLKEIP